MDILKQKIKLREERQKAINSKLNKTKNKINNKETHHRHQSNITTTTDITNLTDNLTNNISQGENEKLNQSKKANQYRTSNTSSSIFSSQKNDYGHHHHHRKISHKKYIIDNGVGLTEENNSFASTPKSKLTNDTNTHSIKRSTVTPTKKNILESTTIKHKNTVSQKDELYWLQQKFVDLQEIIEEKDSRLLEKDKIIAELNEKIHEAEQMKDEMAWLHRKFIEYEEIIKSKDKEIEEKNNIIEEKKAGDNSECGSVVEHPDAFSKKIKWSEDIIQPIDDDDSLIVDEDDHDEDNISEESLVDSKDHIIKRQKKKIEELEKTIKHLYYNTFADAMVQTEDVFVNLPSINERRKSLLSVENETPEEPYILTKKIGLKTYEVEVRNQTCLAALPPRNNDLIIPSFLNDNIDLSSNDQKTSTSRNMFNFNNMDNVNKDISNKENVSLMENEKDEKNNKDDKKTEKEKKKEQKLLEKAKKKEEKEKAKIEKAKAKKEKEKLKKEKKEQKGK